MSTDREPGNLAPPDPETCPYCGGRMVGDGFSLPVACENVDPELLWGREPDAKWLYCTGGTEA